MKEIFLENGRGVALVDDEDYELVSQYSWNLHPGGYAKAACGGPYMHRLILGDPPFDGAQVDHINSDKLDNRRSNLRWASVRQNRGNSKRRVDNASGYKGVSWYARTGKWRARIGIDGREQYLGCFDSPDEAARAYDAKAVELFGEYARLNFPEEWEEAIGRG